MKLMVIDDSKTVRQYHTEILKDAGFTVDEAENGMEGLEKSSGEKYGLFLVDINMPVMDGYSFVENIRKNEHFSSTPIIMISTEAEEQDKLKAYEAGANIYYIKPVKPDDLKACVNILTRS